MSGKPRPDQIRDKDRIRRGAIEARIVGMIRSPILRDDVSDEWQLIFMEPGKDELDQSVDQSVAKFIFTFENLSTIEMLAYRILQSAKEWRQKGYKI